ncbi:TonB-dependent receptor plug domain-containing protein, partial [candidate division KSB1 bacterium]|nr:TonB-dependent receptor plug domain-containing protein [candidate division KSB1 bacterium]
MKSSAKFKSSYLITTILVLLVLSFVLNAQGANKIVGKVTDKDSGDPLPGVNVVISGTSLGAATDIKGYYFILNVPPGTYTLSASMIGYKKVSKKNVRVEINRTTNVNFQLEATTIEGEEVTVVAEKDNLHIEVSSSQIVTTAETIAEAANVRSLEDFVSKQAGIGERLTIRGGSSEQTGTLVEGIEYVDHLQGRSEITLPMSSVEQVAIQSGGFTAD